MRSLESLKYRIPSVYRGSGGRQYAVFVPLIDTDEGDCLLFQVRSRALKRQPGDICFPGGSVEPGETPLQAAFREVREELLVSDESLDHLFDADYLPLGDGSILYPFVGRIEDYDYSYSRAEVDEVFTVPLAFFAENEPDIYRVGQCDDFPEDFPFDRIENGRAYRGVKRYREVPFYYYGERTIWGITARIIHGLVGLLK